MRYRTLEAVTDRPFIAIMRAQTPLEATRSFLDQIQQLDDLAHDRTLRLAQNLRSEIIRRMGTAQNFEAFRLPRLLQDINRTMADWQQKQLNEQIDFTQEYAAIGEAQVIGPVQAAGFDISLPRTSFKLIETSQRFSAVLIKKITDETRTSINREVIFASTGVQSPFEAMKKIESMIDDPLTFNSIADRAETILRTEGGRIQSIAAQGRIEDASHVVPGLKKQWLWSGKSRIQHTAINKQIRDIDKPFDIPAAGRCPADSIMFPRDPAGLACQTINCGCQSIPYKADWNLDEIETA